MTNIALRSVITFSLVPFWNSAKYSVPFWNLSSYRRPWLCRGLLMRWEELEQQPCSLARTLSVVGDRWTLLVLRESFLGIRRFDEFEKRLGITRHVLAERLKKLVEAGVLDKVAYQQRPLREEYCLSAKGRDLYPAIMALVHWVDRHMSGAEGAPIRHIHRSC